MSINDDIFEAVAAVCADNGITVPIVPAWDASELTPPWVEITVADATQISGPLSQTRISATVYTDFVEDDDKADLNSIAAQLLDILRTKLTPETYAFASFDGVFGWTSGDTAMLSLGEIDLNSKTVSIDLYFELITNTTEG